MSFELLVAKLKELESSSLTDEELGISECEEDGRRYFGSVGDTEERHPLVSEIEGMANGELITSKGQAFFAAHKKLGEAGFRVFCGESDSFGWLFGCIRTERGIITYG